MKKALLILLPAVVCFSTALFLSGQDTPGAPEPQKKIESKKKGESKKEDGRNVAPAPAAAPPVPAPPPAVLGISQLPGGQIYEKSLAALTMLFVLAVLLENAFSVIFNWRVFLAYFSLSGAKTVIMVVASWIVVYFLNLDIVARLIAAYTATDPAKPVNPAGLSGPVSIALTALILAGGSSGVNRIMKGLGFRSNNPEEEKVPKPKPTDAWVSVRHKGTERVTVTILDKGPAGVGSPEPLAGVINHRRQSLAGLFIHATDRFPGSGGYTVKPGQVYAFKVATATKSLLEKDMVFAPGAIVDLFVNSRDGTAEPIGDRIVHGG